MDVIRAVSQHMGTYGTLSENRGRRGPPSGMPLPAELELPVFADVRSCHISGLVSRKSNEPTFAARPRRRGTGCSKTCRRQYGQGSGRTSRSMTIIDSYERKRTNRRNIVIYTRPNRDIDLFCLASKVTISTLPWAARHRSCAAAKPRHRGEHRAQPLRVIVVGVGRCVMIGTHVQREGWEAFGGDCRMAGRQLPAGCHV